MPSKVGRFHEVHVHDLDLIASRLIISDHIRCANTLSETDPTSMRFNLLILLDSPATYVYNFICYGDNNNNKTYFHDLLHFYFAEA